MADSGYRASLNRGLSINRIEGYTDVGYFLEAGCIESVINQEVFKKATPKGRADILKNMSRGA